MRIFLFITVLLFALNTNAQKEIDCSIQTKEYQDFLKVNNFSDAFSPWEFVKNNCPKQSESIYTDGIKIGKFKIDNLSSNDEKEKEVRNLMKLYDQFHKYFPEKSQDYEINKAVLLSENIANSDEEVLALLDSGFKNAISKVIDAKIIYTYFKLYNTKFKEGDKNISTDNVIEKYTQLTGLLSKLKISTPERKEDYQAASRALVAEGRNVMNCENLSTYYEKKLPSNLENSEWLDGALETLNTRCSSSPIYLSLAEKFYKIKVTPKSSSYLALASLKNRKLDDAKKYYEESATLENDSIEKASSYYKIALAFYSTNLNKTKEYIQKALSFDPKLSKAHLYLADMYANNAEKCGKNEFEKKAIYYLAIQTAKKALINDPKLQPTVESIIKKFASKSLTLDDIIDAKMNGKSLKIDCDINETINFPSSK
jgi:hypothetical protein